MELYDDLKKRVSTEWGEMGLWLVLISLAVPLFVDWNPRMLCFAAMLIGGIGLIFSQPWGRLVSLGGLGALTLLHILLTPPEQSLWFWCLGLGFLALSILWVYDAEVGKERPEGFERWVRDVEGRPELIREMRARQAEWERELEERDRRRDELLALSEHELLKVLPTLDHEKDGQTAILKLLQIGKVEHWEQLERLLDRVFMAWSDLPSHLREIRELGSLEGTLFPRLYARCAQELASGTHVLREAEAMLLIDPTRAREELADGRWHAPAARLKYVLEALNRCEVTLPAEVIEALHAQGDPTSKDEDALAAQVQLLPMLRATGAADLKPLCYRLIRNPATDSYDCLRAAETICALHGIDDLDAFMSERYARELKREFPFERGDELFRIWCAVGQLDGQVCNGGFSQYFSNGYEYQFADALAGTKRDRRRGGARADPPREGSLRRDPSRRGLLGRQARPELRRPERVTRRAGQ